MFYTAILMGLAGSFHCAGMCSPLAMAITRNKPFLLSSMLYNTGRVLIYMMLGALAASFGSFLHFSAYQQTISVVLGSLFILAGFGILKMKLPLFDPAIVLLTSNLKRVFGAVLSRKSRSTTFMLGMINGMLPCGLTYLALSLCLILPSALDGLLYMLFFGLGTWPVMVGVTKLIDVVILKNQFSIPRLLKITTILIGCTLLLRAIWIHPPGDDHSIKSIDQITVCK
jgi:uncharacterized protein